MVATMTAEDRLSQYKKTVTQSDGHRRRVETQLQIRKTKKDEQLAKRRAAVTQTKEPEQTTISGVTRPVKNYNPVDLPHLLSLITNVTGPIADILEGVQGIRRMLSVANSPPVEEVVNSGALPFLAESMMRVDSSALQFEAAWALTNVASTQFTYAVVETPNAVNYLVQLLRSNHANVREQAAWCLGNIAGDGVEYRNGVLSTGALEALIINLQQPANDNLLGNVVWCVSNLCRGKPQPPLDLVKPACSALGNIIKTTDVEDALTDALWAVSYLSDGEEERIQTVLDTDITHRLVEILRNGNAKDAAPALRTLGNFATGNEYQTQAVVDAGILEGDVALKLLHSSKKSLRKETCWLLSNIAAGTPSQIDCLMDRQKIVGIVSVMASTADWDTRKEALWTVSNIFTQAEPEHVRTLVEEFNGLEPMVAVLLAPSDSRMVAVALDAVKAALQVGITHDLSVATYLDELGGIDAIEKLQNHSSQDIYEKAVEILEDYFGEDDDVEDENLAPNSNGDAFTFGLPPAKNLLGEETQLVAQNQPQIQFGGTNNFNF